MRLRNPWKLLFILSSVAVVCTMIATAQKLAAGPEYVPCTQEKDTNEGCVECADGGTVSWTCPDPHPMNEICQQPFPEEDDIGCFSDVAGCPNNATIWTAPGCGFGVGTSHETTTPCDDIGGEVGAMQYTIATNAVDVEETCQE